MTEKKYSELEKIKKGDIVLNIDGKEIESILQEKLKLITYNNIGWGRIMASRDIFKFIDSDKSSVEVTLSRKSGDTHTVKLPLLKQSEVNNSPGENKDNLTGNIQTEYFDEINTGYLKYSSCRDRGSLKNEYWREKLKEMKLDLSDIPDMEEVCWELFQELRKRNYKYLIVDLRGNMGGNSSIAQVLYKYLTKKDLISYDCKVKISKEIKKKTGNYTFKRVGTFKEYNNVSLKFPYKSKIQGGKIAKIDQFSGTVYILIDRCVYSAGEWLAAELYANKLGTFIGEPTGGGGEVPGDQINFKLPNTELQLLISYKLFVPPSDKNLSGVIPHIWKRQSLQDYRKNKDTVLEFVKNKIKQQRG